MKTMLAGLGAAALISSGSVAAATTSADAAPYPGTVATNCHVDVLGHRLTPRQAVQVEVWVTAAGDGDLKGQASVSAERRNGGDSGSDSSWYSGGRITLSLGKLKAGVYDGTFHFDSKPAKSVYKNCSQGFSFRVQPRRG